MIRFLRYVRFPSLLIIRSSFDLFLVYVDFQIGWPNLLNELISSTLKFTVIARLLLLVVLSLVGLSGFDEFIIGVLFWKLLLF